jgi:hypothetical protein
MERAAARSASRRFERKFFVPGWGRKEVEAGIRVHPALFSEIHRIRDVNNLYLDTPDLGGYRDNINGVSSRTKVRVRWYGDLFGRIDTPVLEVKHKRGNVGWKEGFPLPGFELNRDFQAEALAYLLRTADLPQPVRIRLISIEVRLLNRFRRRYFRSADRRFRITVDDGLEWYRINPRFNSFVARAEDRQQVILELKYKEEHDARAAAITGSFRFRMTRSSKYVRGLEAVSLV